MTGDQFRAALDEVGIPQRRLALWLATFGTTTEGSHINTVNRWAKAGAEPVPDTAAAIVDLLRRIREAGQGLPWKR